MTGVKLCECGCGQPAPVATRTEDGYRRGETKRFVRGHSHARMHRLDSSYEISDGGFDTPCWLYLGHIDRKGYGSISLDGRNQMAHRIYYERAVGPLGDLHLHHRCANTRCVNPEHLQPVTRGEHTRIEGALITHCKRGHSLAEHGRPRKGRGGRYCLRCIRERNRGSASPAVSVG